MMTVNTMTVNMSRDIFSIFSKEVFQDIAFFRGVLIAVTARTGFNVRFKMDCHNYRCCQDVLTDIATVVVIVLHLSLCHRNIEIFRR